MTLTTNNFNRIKKSKLFLTSLVVLTFGLNSCKYNRPLKHQLATIWMEDQEIRNERSKAWKKFGGDNATVDSLDQIMNYIDSVHIVKITLILDEYGWVGKDEVGKLSSNTLSLIIQHSDLRTQQKYLPMMRNAVKEGKAEPPWLALVEDRVALREGRKQIYGSQIFFNKNTNSFYVAPLEDPDNVDKRRLEVGLDLIGHYVKYWGIIWDVEEYKKQLAELENLEKPELEILKKE